MFGLSCWVGCEGERALNHSHVCEQWHALHWRPAVLKKKWEILQTLKSVDWQCNVNRWLTQHLFPRQNTTLSLTTGHSLTGKFVDYALTIKFLEQLIGVGMQLKPKTLCNPWQMLLTSHVSAAKALHTPTISPYALLMPLPCVEHCLNYYNCSANVYK